MFQFVLGKLHLFSPRVRKKSQQSLLTGEGSGSRAFARSLAWQDHTLVLSLGRTTHRPRQLFVEVLRCVVAALQGPEWCVGVKILTIGAWHRSCTAYVLTCAVVSGEREGEHAQGRNLFTFEGNLLAHAQTWHIMIGYIHTTICAHRRRALRRRPVIRQETQSSAKSFVAKFPVTRCMKVVLCGHVQTRV